MRKILIIVISIMLIVLGSILFIIPNQATLSNKSFINGQLKFDTSSIKVDNKASLMMNLNTNQVLYQTNSDKPLPVYSVSKVMFLATAANRIKSDNISYTKKIKVSSHIEKVQKYYSFSNSFIVKGEYYTIEELFKAVMLPSGNDAAILLAEYLFGSHLNGVNAMNEFAKELEMENSTFVSTSGLDGKYLKKVNIQASNGKNLMSVNDLIILIKYVETNAPIIIDISSAKQTYIGRDKGKILLKNVNTLIEANKKGYPSVYGLKTGSNIEEYSNSLIALKKDEKDQNIMSITLGSKSRNSMYKDVKSMYNYLKKLDRVDLSKGINIDSNIGFSTNEVSIGLKDKFVLYVEEDQMFTYKISNPRHYNGILNRFIGVSKNSVIGELEIVESDYFYNAKVAGLSNVVVLDEIMSMSFLEKIQQIFYDIFSQR